MADPRINLEGYGFQKGFREVAQTVEFDRGQLEVLVPDGRRRVGEEVVTELLIADEFAKGEFDVQLTHAEAGDTKKRSNAEGVEDRELAGVSPNRERDQ